MCWVSLRHCLDESSTPEAFCNFIEGKVELLQLQEGETTPQLRAFSIQTRLIQTCLI